MKKCTTCHENKSLNEFNKNKSKRDGLGNVCRECSKARSKKYYSENRDKHILAVRNRKIKVSIKIKKWFQEYKESRECIACGENCASCLDFHHDGYEKKQYDVSDMVSHNYSEKRILKEISKCIVLCANCHRKLHSGHLRL